MKSLATAILILLSPAGVFGQDVKPEVLAPPVVETPVAESSTDAATDPNWPQQPKGFADQNFGTPMPEMPIGMRSECKVKAGKTAGGTVMSCHNASFPITNTIRVKANFEYMRPAPTAERVFTGVELTVTNKNMKIVRELLFAKYGRPMDRGDREQGTRGQAVAAALFGGPMTTPVTVSEWWGNEVTIVMTETEPGLGRSTIEIRRLDKVKEAAEKSVF